MFNLDQTTLSAASQALTLGTDWRTPISKDALQKALFAKRSVVQNPALVSEIAFGDVYMVGDYTSLYRASEDFGLTLLDMYPSTNLSWVRDFCSTKDMITTYQTFGSLSGITFLVGLFKMLHASYAIGYADTIEDRRGALLGRISIVEGASMGGAGATAIGFRVLTIFDTIKEIKPESLLGRICHGFSFASLIFWSLFFAALATILGIRMYDGLKFQKKLSRAEDLAGQIEIIQKQLYVDSNQVYAKLVQKHESDAAARKALIDEGYRMGQENLRGVLKELGITNVSEERLKDMVHDIIEEGIASGTDVDMQQRVEEKLMSMDLEMRVQKIRLKKQAKMQRVLGGAGLKAMQEVSSATSLAGRVRNGDVSAIDEGGRLVDVIKKSTKRQITESTIVIGVLVLGIAAMVAAIALTGGSGILVATALMLIFSITMLLVDGYYLLESYRDDRPAPHDKKMVAASAVLGVSSLLAVSALGLSGVITLGIVPMIISFVLAAIWLGQNGVTWAILNRNERRYLEKHPTLETLMKALDADQKEQVKKMYANLPQMYREMLDAMSLTHGDDLKEKTRAVIQEVERAKKIQLEALRQALEPHLVKLSTDYTQTE